MAISSPRPDRDVLRGVLRHRAFRALTVGRSLTFFGNSMAPVVLAFAVLDLGGSAVDVGLVVGARSVSSVVLLIFGGLLADRLPRALVLQGAAASAALVQSGVGLAVLADRAPIAALLVLSMVQGAVAAVSIPASAALLPRTVPPDELRPGNALSRMGLNTGMIAGTSLGGMLAAVAGPGWGMVLDGAAFLGAAAAYRLTGRVLAGRAAVPSSAAAAEPATVPDPVPVRAPVPVPDPVPAVGSTGSAERARPWQDMRQGWREFASRTWVWVVVLQFFVVNAVSAGGIQVLGPTVADATFGRAAWGFVLATQMAGALVGGLLVARSRSRHALRIGVAVVALDALPLVALAESAGLALLLVAMFVNGIALEQFSVAWDLSLQENVPQDTLARVYSYDALGSTLALPLGEMAAGPLAERFGVRPTLLCGVGLVLLVTAGALGSSQVRGLTAGGTAPDEGAPEHAAV
ncbi:MFS transporter [Streptomyces qinglanensis]|uniref:Predicted arabinose efflux permease, MFS family n=1 Tax=Streptomyces qinglanensis TaxID=943816 RepID=A0A1H9UV04_9ACTN|nr:MFS transporter [Streptomyces qinglanensis]SES13246.1 Predicted arabinose efflux permease, MFS family [Streptomyces qinglanensis]